MRPAEVGSPDGRGSWGRAAVPPLAAILILSAGGLAGWGSAQPVDPAIGVSPTGLPLYADVTLLAGLGGYLHAGYLGPDEVEGIQPVFTEVTGPGACWLDHDGDGWLDLYAVNGIYQTFPELNAQRDPHSMLFRNLGDGTFADVTGATGTGLVGIYQGCAAADYDNDADPDLYVTAHGGGRLLRNDGGAFADVTTAAGVDDSECGAFACWSSSASWLDLDQDGCLDLFVDHFTDYIVDPPGRNRPGPGQVNRLFVSNCNGTFEDRTQAAGLVEKSDSWSSVAADYDSDGRTDLYVSNDGDENDLYRNDGDGTFTRLATMAADPLAGMGTSAGDINHDGRLDIITTNFVDQYNGIYVADGSDYIAIGDQDPFTDAFSWSGWAAHWFDITNDGNTDLMVVNGLPESYGLLETAEPVLLYQNLDGALGFRSIRTEVGEPITHDFDARGAAWADYDDDGDVDVVVMEAGDNPLHFFRADVTGGNFISIDLVGAAPGVTRDAIGARVTVTAQGVLPQYQQKVAGSGFMSSNDPRLHYGLLYAESATASVRWPDGSTETWTGLRANGFYRLTQGVAAAEVLRESPIVRIAGPAGGERGAPLTFEADVVPSAGASPASVAWDLGGEAVAAGSSATHGFTDVGSYVVRAAATDTLGRTATQAVTVTVSADLVARIEMGSTVYMPLDTITGEAIVTFEDGARVQGASVYLLVLRSSGNQLVDSVLGSMPLFVRQLVGYVPYVLSGTTDADGVYAFEVPRNLVSPAPAVPLEAHHAGEYVLTATGAARGSTIGAAEGTFEVVASAPDGAGRPDAGASPAVGRGLAGWAPES